MRANGLVDLRSDTLTRPTPAMREAIARAEVGDDVYGEDPTVNRLQDAVAELMGKEAALFVPSGTMANQLAIRTWCEPGDEVILDKDGHSLHFEGGATAALSGVQVRPVDSDRGIFGPEHVAAGYRTPDVHAPRSRLVIAENTSNFGGGRVWPFETLQAVGEAARSRGLSMHLDGARLMNAVVKSGRPAREWAACTDSVSLCLSKGLGAPVGTVLAGPADFIRRAHRFRKQFGGGMRQAGLLAAAGLHALEHHVDRLAEDHANARRLAEALAEVPGVVLDPEGVETNIVFFDLAEGAPVDARGLAEALRARDVRLSATGPRRLRAVTHLDVDAEDVDRAVAAVREVLGA